MRPPQGWSKVRVREEILDLLQALSGLLQRFLQPLELSSGVRLLTCDFIRPVVEDRVETNQPQTRFYQLGVEPACRSRAGVRDKCSTIERDAKRQNEDRQEDLLTGCNTFTVSDEPTRHLVRA